MWALQYTFDSSYTNFMDSVNDSCNNTYLLSHSLANIKQPLNSPATMHCDKREGLPGIYGNVFQIFFSSVAWNLWLLGAVPSSQFFCVPSLKSSNVGIRWCFNVDGLVQERYNSSASAMELRLSCTNPPKWWFHHVMGNIVYAMFACHNESYAGR